MFKSKCIIMAALAVALGVSACSRDTSKEDRPGFSLPQSPLLSALERKAGLIAYVGNDGNVYIVDQSGKNPVALTTDAKLKDGDFNFYEFPTWSRDGQSVAFYGLKGTSNTDVTATVYTADAEGKSVVSAYSSDRDVPIYLSWSPDAHSVAFISSLSGGDNIVLNLVPAAGGEAQVLDIGSPFYWDWLPDSSGVLVHSGGPSSLDPEARLALLTLNDGVVEDTLALKPAAFQSPALSPEGGRVLLAIEDDSGKNDLVIADRLGAVETTLTELDGPAAFAWSPDGTKVAYIAGDAGAQLTLGKLTTAEVGADGISKSAEVSQEDVVAFFWAPDSKQIAYFVLAQADQPTPEPGTTADPNAQPSYYLKLYVIEAGSTSGKLIASYAPSSEFWRTIPYFDQYSRSATIWSPDSQNLVLTAYTPDGVPGVYVVPASGITEPRFLLEGTMAFWSGK